MSFSLQVFAVHTLLDNLDIDPSNGDIWTAAHPLGLKLHLFLDNPDPAVHTTPSQVNIQSNFLSNQNIYLVK